MSAITDSSIVSVFVTHGQLAVSDPSLEEPFNEWNDQHFSQGFSWRPGSVSFRTLQEAGPHIVDVDVLSGDPKHQPACPRIIDVPFTVPPSGRIEIASVTASAYSEVAPGLCQLRFEAGAAAGDERLPVRLLFWPSVAPVFRIIRSDLEPPADGRLLLTAAPA